MIHWNCYHRATFRWKNWKFQISTMWYMLQQFIVSKTAFVYTGPNHGNHVREWHIRVEIESRDRGGRREPTDVNIRVEKQTANSFRRAWSSCVRWSRWRALYSFCGIFGKLLVDVTFFIEPRSLLEPANVVWNASNCFWAVSSWRKLQDPIYYISIF